MKEGSATVSNDPNETTPVCLSNGDATLNSAYFAPSAEGNSGEEEHGTRRSSGSGFKKRLGEGAGQDESDVSAKKPRLMTASDDVVPAPDSSTSSPKPLNGGSMAPFSTKRKLPYTADGGTGDKSDTQKTEEPPAKRTKLDDAPGVDSIQENIIPKPSPITCLPLEILAEILLLTRCPSDLLAVARTCRALCVQLLSPDASFIWKKTRIAVELPGPEAFDGTMEDNGPSTSTTGVKCFIGREAAYAAFIFDGGICESCGEETKRKYLSFSLRLRTCENADCIRAIKKQLLNETKDYADNGSWSTVPVVESSSLLPAHLAGSPTTWPRIIKASRPNLVIAAVQKYANRGQEEIDCALTRNNAWMQLCVALVLWRNSWETALRVVKDANKARASVFANKEGWVYSDILETTSYINFSEGKLKWRENTTMAELEELRPTIAKELYHLREKRNRKEMTRIREANRNDLWKFYQKLMSKPDKYPILPPFSTFLKLPAIELLQSSDLVAAKIGVKTIVAGDSFTNKMIKQQIEQWVEQAKHDLLDSLGCGKEWNEMVPALQMPHPVLRLDARWNCRVCDQVEKKYEMDGCLDFAGVCRHECKVKEGKSRRKGTAKPWQATNFVRDERACAVVRTCFDRVDLKMGELGKITSLFKNTIWICESCNPHLLVRAESLIGHSHRHANLMEIGCLLSGSTAPPWPNTFGLTQWLLSGKKDSAKWVEKSIYACRHCHRTKGQSRIQEKHDNDNSNGPELVEQKAPDQETNKTEKHTEQCNSKKARGKDSNRFHLNGLRSHLSSKHKIHQIRDEDYYCSELVPYDGFALINAMLSSGWT